MTILSKLNHSDMTRSKMIASPEALLRHKLLGALEEQIAAANADKSNEPYVKRASRFVSDQETGERLLVGPLASRWVPMRGRTTPHVFGLRSARSSSSVP